MSTKFELCTCKMSDETLKWNNIHTFVCAHYITYTSTKIIKLYYFPQITFKRHMYWHKLDVQKNFLSKLKCCMTMVENWPLTSPALYSKSHGAGKTGETWPIYILWPLPWAWQKFFYSMMQRALMMHPLRMTINKIKFATSSEKECYHTLYVYNIRTWILKKIQFLDFLHIYAKMYIKGSITYI